MSQHPCRATLAVVFALVAVRAHGDVPLFDKPPRGGHGPEAFGDQAYSAVRLANGNTLIGTGNGHSVLDP